MQTRMLGPGFAAEVSGIDPSGPIADADAAELRSLLDEHQLLVLRCRGLDGAAQIRFMGIFGPIYDESRDSCGYSYISNVIGAAPNGRFLFHQDFAVTPFPHRVLSLYGEEVQGAVAPTRFVSNTRAFERLSPTQRDAWRGLSAAHARNNTRTGRPDDEFVRVKLRELPDGEDKSRYPRAVHPLLWPHPRTGATMLFVTEYYTSHVLELPTEAGEQAILDACAVLYEPEAIYAHEWRPGDLVVWDNIALQHARPAVKPDTRRTLRRSIVNDHVHEPAFHESAARAFARPQ